MKDALYICNNYGSNDLDENLIIKSKTVSAKFNIGYAGSGYWTSADGSIEFDFPNALVGVISASSKATWSRGGVSSISGQTVNFAFNGHSGSGSPYNADVTIIAIGY